MERSKLGTFLDALNDVESKALKFGLACFSCGAHAGKESTNEQRLAMSTFTQAVDDFRLKITKEFGYGCNE